MIHGNGVVGIGFSLFEVAIAALNLVLDFDFIETGVERGAPKYLEWYDAFGLMITLEWLYKFGRASSREKTCKYVYMSVAARSFKKSTISTTTANHVEIS